jgi:hypothetical protein
MLTPRPGSNIQILKAVTSRHLVPVIDVDRTDQSQPLYVAAAALQPSSGAGAPVDYAAAVAATLVIDSIAANADLTFTATVPGAAGNAFTVAIEQPVEADQELTIEFDGTNAVILLPTDSSGDPVAVTATEVKAAWDGGMYIPLPDAYPLTNFMTVVVEGTGAGAVDATAVDNLANGTDVVLGSGNGSLGYGAVWIDVTTPAIYVNQGTKDEPAWAVV